MKIDILGVPLFYGCDRHGVENGPAQLRDKGLLEIFENAGHKVYDLGNLCVEEVTEFDKYEAGTTMKYLTPLTNTNNNLAESVYASIKAGAFPFSVGGDHAMGLGTLAGAAKAFGEDYGVVWIDAHGDINTEESSPSGNVHGMPLAASMGFGSEKLKNIFFEGKKVDPKNVFLICQRDLDAGEVDLIKEYNINLWTSDDVNEKGIETIMSEVTAKMAATKINNFHISFDIDAMDSSLVPGTGTPVADGVSVEQTQVMLERLFETKKIKAMDFVEYNPGLEYDITTENCLKVLDTLANKCMK